MCMKNIVLTSMLLAFLPLLAVAQSNDDLYFIPKKEKKVEVKENKVGVVPKEVSNKTVKTMPSDYGVVIRDSKGNVRDVDEYNRRYTSRDNTFSSDGQTLYIDEKPYNERGEWVNGFQGSDMDYEYAMRIIRFRNPKYAIPVSSPLYWDVVYGALPSWDWNVYDDGMYAYVFPTYTNRLWWDWRFSSGFYGPGWGFSIGWGSPWYYSHWHSPYWYSGWYGGWYGGYWGHHWHNHYHGYYPYYGWGGGWYNSRRYNYNTRKSESDYWGRGNSYRQYTTGSGNRNNTRVVGVRDNNGRTGGRVVSSDRNSSAYSVRSSSGGSIRQSGNNAYTRPSRLNERGSVYSRPSSTRVNTVGNRDYNYNNNNNSSRYNFNNNNSNRSTITTTRSFGGSTRSTTTVRGGSSSSSRSSGTSSGGGIRRR